MVDVSPGEVIAAREIIQLVPEVSVIVLEQDDEGELEERNDGRNDEGA